MPETPEAHKEMVEIKKEVREVRQTQDAGVFRERRDWEKLLWDTVKDNRNMMRILLAINGLRTKREIEKELQMSHNMCWRLFDRLEAAGIIAKLPDTKDGGVPYDKLRWYKLLRMDEQISGRLSQSIQSSSNEPQETLQTEPALASSNEQPQNPDA